MRCALRKNLGDSMDSRFPTNGRKGRLLLAVGVSMLFPIGGTVVAIAAREIVMLPGALISVAFYGVMGYFAIQGRQWAKWIVFAFLLGTALLGLGFAFVSLGTGSPEFGFNPWVAAVVLFYVGAAILIAVS